VRGHIRKRGHRWLVVVYHGRDAEGKKRYRWFSHPTRRTAEGHLTQLLAQAQAGDGLPPSRLKLSQFLESWLSDYAEGHVGPTTLAGYRIIVRRHLVPALGHVPLSRLTAQTIQGYLTRMLQSGRSSTTALHHYRLLHQALKHAYRWGLIARNPADLVDAPSMRKAPMRVWDEEQTRLFLAEARRSSRFYALYLTAVLTGMRRGELLGLRWRDVDMLLGTISVQQTFYRLGKQQLFQEPKTQTSRRRVDLPQALVAELAALRKEQQRLSALLGDEYKDHDLVFAQSNGKPLHGGNLSRRDFPAIQKNAKLPRIRFHDLRHCHATQLLRAGVNPKVVQERLGHATPAFTLAVYSHTLPGMQAAAAQTLADRLLRDS
jgi:integrase